MWLIRQGPINLVLMSGKLIKMIDKFAKQTVAAKLISPFKNYN